ncbi:MAG: AAA family ATPase, partial [Spirochaetales bacterium]|nr:AAA family ATPase [Spirochaetales bacterium]
MKIQRLEINNFRGINTMKISCNDHLNIFCGVNGSGKSSILDSIVLQLSWIIARIRQSKGGGGRPIGEFDVKNDKGFSMINMQILDNDTVYTGVLVKGKKGIMIKERSDMSEFSKYAKKIKQDITDNNGTTSIPLFVYYSTNRAVTEKSLRFRTKHDFNLLETYEDSLRTGVNFTSFFKWYRSREDLENELYREQLSNQESNSQYDGDKQLRVVRSALKALSGFEGVSVKRRPQRMEVIKNGVKLRVEQLSDGEK